MFEVRITQLVDGEELISFVGDERAKTLPDDPRQELLEHRSAAIRRSPVEVILGGSEAFKPNVECFPGRAAWTLSFCY